MQIKFRWKTNGSNTGQCPALYEVICSAGGFVVQGKRTELPGTVAVNTDVLERLPGFSLNRCEPSAITIGEPGWYLVSGEQLDIGDEAWQVVQDLADDETAVHVPAAIFGLVS